MAVLFVDMDYFFAACEELAHPELKGKPLIVGTSPEPDRLKGVVQTCNYEARKFGIRSAMPAAKAFELCPGLRYMPDNYRYYEDMSKRVMALIRSYGFPVEQDSVDEAAMDLNGKGYDEAERIGRELKARINGELGLPCTVAISFGKYFAKMMCDASKPDGFGILKEEGIHGFLDAKPVGRLPGVGEKTEKALKAMGINTISELASANRMVILEKFGSSGIGMQRLASGIDDSRVVSVDETLSIGRQSTLSIETTDMKAIGRKLRALGDEVAKEASLKGFRFKNVGVMVRYEDFTQVTRSSNLGHYSGSSDDIYKVAVPLVKSLVNGKKVRKLGVRVSALLGTKGQKALF